MLRGVYRFPSDLQAKLAQIGNYVENKHAMKANTYVIAILLGICACAHGESKEAAVSQFTLSSPNFRDGQPIPAKHSCEGGDVSPELKWEGAPAGTKNFALISDDPDAPGGTWVHWVLYGIPANALGVPEKVNSSMDSVYTIQGVNDFGKVGYGGPCPPRGHGVHHYHFRLYALDTELKLAPRVTRYQLDVAMKGHIIVETELVGTYQRD
jgi:Raf kinase inhibitor-like YbhB/YbcL family protein